MDQSKSKKRKAKKSDSGMAVGEADRDLDTPPTPTLPSVQQLPEKFRNTLCTWVTGCDDQGRPTRVTTSCSDHGCRKSSAPQQIFPSAATPAPVVLLQPPGWGESSRKRPRWCGMRQCTPTPTPPSATCWSRLRLWWCSTGATAGSTSAGCSLYEEKVQAGHCGIVSDLSVPEDH